jgi:hypothetical protein
MSDFAPASLSALEEPVRRYFNHALAPGAVVAGGRRFSMAGRIKVGRWLAFDAVQEMSDGHAFTWTARAGLGPIRPLHVVDRYRLGAGSTEGRFLGRLRFMHADDQDTRVRLPAVQRSRASWTRRACCRTTA